MASAQPSTIAQLESERYKTMTRILGQIRESVALETLFTTTTQAVRALLNADRVLVFRKWPAGEGNQGQFIAEDVAPGWVSALGERVESWEVVADRIRVSSDAPPEARSPDSHFCDRLQVRSELTVPLRKDNCLWGGLCVHQCRGDRQWEPGEIEWLGAIGELLAMALQQSEERGVMQVQVSQQSRVAEREKAVARTIDRIRRSLDIQTIFDTATQEVRQLLNADRVAVYRFNPDWSGYFVAESFAPGWNALVGNLPPIADTHLQESAGGRYRHNQSLAVDDIYNVGHSECHIRLLEQFQAKAYIIVPIMPGNTLWGLLAAYQNSGPRQWHEDEVELLAQIGVQFGIAVQQAELLEKTQKQTAELSSALHSLQEAQSQLVQNEKMASLGQLVAGVAHELNNPVNFISGNLNHAGDYTDDLLELLQLYQAHYPTPETEIQDFAEAIELDFLREDLPKLLQSMKVGVNRIRGLVSSLRNFSRLDRAEKIPVNLHEGIDSTLLILQPRLKSRPDRPGIEVVKEYGELPPVECYAAQMNQVFMNILSNAIDALDMRDRGLSVQEMQAHPKRISIRTEFLRDDRQMANSSTVTNLSPSPPTPSVVICIADNGPGISESVRSRIFDPFFTTKPVGSGTGLGLSISYQIVVEKHGGTISCVSQPGQGTKFYIHIPLAQAQLTSEAA
jgi:signal transduction histidine kinase